MASLVRPLVYAVGDGASSYGIWIRDCDENLLVTANVIYAGDGSAGAVGTDGQNGAAGGVGANGRNAFDFLEKFGLDISATCSNADHSSAGGQGGANAVVGMSASGGDGGMADCPLLDDTIPETYPPNPSESGGAGAGSGAGDGGSAGRDVYHMSFSCTGYETYAPTDGGAGVDGDDGTDGIATTANLSPPVSLTLAGLWSAPIAEDGGDGQNGSGGGGGGSGGGAFVHASCYSKGYGGHNLGATGGGGGAGGEAGSGGKGGQYGGGSFGVWISFSAPSESLPELSGNTIHTGNGGVGGDGGTGGTGGDGGNGGLGGSAWPTDGDPVFPEYPSFPGGNGGAGGRGGHGAGGNGGDGGPTYGIACASVPDEYAATLESDNLILLDGTGGDAGQAGQSDGNSGEAGLAGESEAVFLVH